MRESTQGRSHSNVLSVGNAFLKNTTLEGIRGSTQERSPTDTSGVIIKPTLGRSHINATNVDDFIVPPQAFEVIHLRLKVTAESIQERNLTNAQNATDVFLKKVLFHTSFIRNFRQRGDSTIVWYAEYFF
uniref:Uncharacterized protein n=1 Tax=Laticauda laticaudata TaxID=8630 RepID=A0A8C5WVP0_LATLA